MPHTRKIEDFYHTFREIIGMVHSSRSAKEVMDLAVMKSTELLHAKGAVLRLYNPEANQFEVAAASGIGENYLSKGPVSGKTILTNPIKNNKVVIVKHLWNDPRVEYPKEAWDEGIRMILDVPLTVEREIIGLMRIYLSEQRDFCEEELDFMIAVGQQCACAIDKARFIEAQQAKFDYLVLKTDKLSALGRMAAGIAHEINNPLAGILLYSSNMRKKAPQSGPLREGLDVIIGETRRCKKIIEELLEFSRDREPNKTLADVNEVVEKAVRILENEFRINRIRLEKQLSEEVEKVLLDEVQMEQVLVNLLVNAIQATGEEGRISVQTSLDPDRRSVWIEVVDNGCGIPRKDMNRLFEPFFSTKPKGTGLGLAVSYRIVRNHQGDMEVLSDQGKGTRFIIELPALRTASAGKAVGR